MDAPNSFRDPFWTDLAASTEQKLGLPGGLLVAVLTKGERSNANQVSEAGARTPFQIIPATRKAAVDKYGIDPYLSAQNAAEVAGLLLKDSLKRNGDDPAAAVAEYHGGTNRDNWGPRTKAYVGRVLDGAQSFAVADPAPAVAVPLQPDVSQPMPAGQSTFDRLMAKMGKPQESQIASVFQAYQAGQMPKADAAQFEDDVRAGRIMLPRGAALKPAEASTAGPAPMTLPPGVVQAYYQGRLTPQERDQLHSDLRAGLVLFPAQGAIPGAEGEPLRVAQARGAPQPGILDKALGTGEAALTAITGATGGALGMVGGAIGGAANVIRSGQFGTPAGADAIERAAAGGAQALTYAPRTQSGQDQAAALGEGMQQLIPVMGATPGLPMAALSTPKGTPAGVLARAGVEGTVRDVANLVARPAEAVGLVAPGLAGDAAAGAAASGIGAVGNAAAKVASLVRESTTLPRRAFERITGGGDASPTPGTMGSVGAAGVDMATQRQALASDFPVPIRLTKGQASRDPAQLKFEVETAKLPEAGAPLRQRLIETNEAILGNFDTWADQTGAEAPTLRATGMAVDQALVAKARAAKNEVNAAYAKANKSPEAGALVDPGAVINIGEGDRAIAMSPIDYLNSKPVGLKTTALTDHARQYAVKLGIAEAGQDGQLIGRKTTIKTMEAWRKEISQATGYEPAEIRDSTILKAMIDGQTEPVAGPLYRQARATRARYAQQFEDHSVISKLLNNKRGTSDRQVAFEDVLKHSVLDGSLDDVRTVRKVLQTGGEAGQQAWRELQGATLRHIRDEATKSVALDSAGNRVLSPAALDKAIRALDADGKLDFVFGKKGAQQLRDINELAQIAKTVPPEAAINMSNTATTLLSAMGDIAGYGMSGAPVPVFTLGRMALKHIKDVKLRQRIGDALNELPAKKAPNNAPGTPGIDPAPATVH